MGGKTSQSNQQVQVPPAVLAQYQSVVSQANQTAQLPFQQYSGQFVAPVNAQQTTGINATNNAASEAQPYYGAATNQLGAAQSGVNPINNAATGLAGASAEQVNAQQIGAQQIAQFENPYLQSVLGSTAGLINQNNAQQQQGALGTAIQSGAFGGDRTGIAAANLEQQQNLANSNIYSGIASNAFNTALGAAQQQQGVNLGAQQANRAALGAAGSELAGIGSTAYGEGANTANTLAALGSGAQTAGLQGASAQIGAGTLEQQTAQAQDTAQYNQFLQQQSFPYQVGSWLAGISEGTGALSGSTTTTTQPGGFFSDIRLKHSIKKIGKLYDGQHIYSYKMHGDPRTHIGLIAQEVEKKHPESVGLAAGYKMVDYGKATDKAANRGHFREGGVVPLKRAAGGETDLDAILASHAAMYGQPGPTGSYGLAAGSTPRGGSSRVPAPVEGGHQLMTAQGGLRAQPTGIQNVNSLAQLAKTGQQIYNKVEAPPSQTPPLDVQPTPSMPAAADPSYFDPSTQTPVPTAARGGGIRSGYDAGGMPYSGGLDIPYQPNQRQLATAGALPSQGSSGLQNLAGIASIASDFMRRGGRARFDGGGGVAPYDVPDGQLDIPDTQSSAKLATAPGLAGGSGGGMSSTGQDIKDVAQIAGIAAMFLKNGGGVRRGYDDGGAPDELPEVDVDSTRPDPVDPTVPVDLMASNAPTPERPPDIQAPQTGVAAGSDQPSDQPQDHWYKHAENVIPLLTGLAAMGTAPTKHLGVALASGLGAGAQAWLPAQAQSIANQTAQTRLGLLQGATSAPPPTSVSAPPKQPMLAGVGTDPTEIAGNTKNRFAVSDIWTPQEQSSINYNAKLQRAGLPNALASIQAAHTARIQNLTTANQQGASVAYDQSYAVASAPPGAAFSKMRSVAPQEAERISQISQSPEDADGLARTWASQVGNAVYRYAGREPIEGTDGIQRDKLNGRPVLGQVPVGMSAEQHANYLERLATPVDTGAPSRPALGATAAGRALPTNPQPSVQVPGNPTPSPASPQRPAVRATAPVTAKAAGPDFSGAPPKPAWVDNPNLALTDAQKNLAHQYAEKEGALRAEADSLPKTQLELIKAQRVLNELPNAKTGPGTATMSAVQTALGNMTGSQFTSWLDSNPSAHSLLQKQLGQQALDDRLNEMRGAGAQVKLGAQQDNLIINKLSASTEMPKDAIRSLVQWDMQEAQYQLKRQSAILPYLSAGKDARAFDNFYASPGQHPMQNSLSSAAPAGTTLPPRPGQATSGATKVINGVTYTQKNGKWYAG